MAVPEHVDLIDPELHEAKGCAAATTNTVLTSVTGVGMWAKITSTNLNTTSIPSVNGGAVTASLADVSTVSFVLIPMPVACTVNTIYFTIANAITLADSTITITNSTGPATLGTRVIAFTGSAEGTTFTFTATVNNTFTAGTYLKIATDGVSTTAAVTAITVVYTKT